MSAAIAVPSAHRQRRQAATQLGRVRVRIDKLDERIVRLLNRRAVLALRTKELKRMQGKVVFDGIREREVLRRINTHNDGPLSASALRKIYREVLQTSRSLAKWKK